MNDNDDEALIPLSDMRVKREAAKSMCSEIMLGQTTSLVLLRFAATSSRDGPLFGMHVKLKMCSTA